MLTDIDDHSSPEKAYIKDQVLDHLRSGRSITPKEAFLAFGCSSLSGTIHALRKEGWIIGTDRMRDENGERYPSYRLFEGWQQKTDTTPLFDQIYSSELEQIKPMKNAVQAVESITIRMGRNGPELQILADEGDGDSVFYRLSPAQVRYLSLNLKLFEEMNGSAD